MQNNQLALIAVMAALALLGVIVVVTVAVTIPLQRAEAAKSATGQYAGFLQNRTARLCH